MILDTDVALFVLGSIWLLGVHVRIILVGGY